MVKKLPSIHSKTTKKGILAIPKSLRNFWEPRVEKIYSSFPGEQIPHFLKPQGIEKVIFKRFYYRFTLTILGNFHQNKRCDIKETSRKKYGYSPFLVY